MGERVNLSDWEGAEQIGEVEGGSNQAWETVVALTCLQNPGIYLRFDSNELLVIDHVEAKVVKRNNRKVVLKITNPTSYDANVSILAEDAEHVKKTLEWNAFLKWPKVEVKRGKTRTVEISSDGRIMN